VRIQKAEAAEKAATDDLPHELTNIRVEEVSIVDRAANRRKFLVKKREGTPMKKNKADEPVDSDKPVVVDADEIVDLAAPAKKGDADKAKEQAEAAKEREREKAIAASVDDKAVKADPPPDPPLPKDPPATATTETPAETPPAASTPATPGTSGPDDPTVPGKPESEVGKASMKCPNCGANNSESAVYCSACGGKMKAAKGDAEVDKIGRPMSAARLERLRAAQKTIDDILNEVDPPAAPEKPAGDISLESATTPAAKSAGQEVLPVDLSLVNKAIADNNEKIAGIANTVAALQKMVKEMGEQLAKRQIAVDSNTISLEKSVSEDDKVVWPADIAARPKRLPGRSF
jgi:hypothetical protein